MTANKTAKIQFYEGTDEPVVPEIRLTRSKDGTTGQALFLFEKPQALSSITEGEITGMRMIDTEGEISTSISLNSFINGGNTRIKIVNTITDITVKTRNNESGRGIFKPFCI